MKDICLLLLFGELLIMGCENITNVIEIGDSYLPNLHWTVSGGGMYVEVDTVFGTADEEIKFRLEIYYDNPDDFRAITIGYSELWYPIPDFIDDFSGGFRFNQMTDNRITSSLDTIIYNYTVNPVTFTQLYITGSIYEENSEFDLMRYKNIIVFNRDSL